MLHKGQLLLQLLEERSHLYFFGPQPQVESWAKEEDKGLWGRRATWAESWRLQKEQMQVV